ncbi:hypothetical protein ACH47B_26595 [Rhodococcus sp. NPDC019627]|uniref:hypothetical protein n=1 Tax=unclassified Rhodococcus (in: high G+C Gram-positive bacteria) TaxID=192944 RepID=UPI0033ED38CA
MLDATFRNQPCERDRSGGRAEPQGRDGHEPRRHGGEGTVTTNAHAPAYKGIAALLLGNRLLILLGVFGALDWMEHKALDKVQHVHLAVDIHLIWRSCQVFEHQGSRAQH